MADRIACLTKGKVVLIREGHEPEDLESPYAEQIAARERAMIRKNAGQELPLARVVGIARGRVSGELYYAISTGVVSGIFAQKPGTREEHRLFHSADATIRDVDFSFADEAFTCTVESREGTSAIGILADDGKGVRTVTEGDVLDRGPRWVPGGVAEIVYASAGIGRTQSGVRAGRSPFSLHRLRLNDSTVEVLVSDAKHDYVAPVAVSDSLIYAIRRGYEESKPKTSVLAAIADPLLALARSSSFFSARRAGKSRFTRGDAKQKAAAAERVLVWGNWVEVEPDTAESVRDEGRAACGYELVRVTPKSTEVVADGVIAFDVAPNGDVVYSSGRALYRMAATKGAQRKLLANVHLVEQIVVC